MNIKAKAFFTEDEHSDPMAGAAKQCPKCKTTFPNRGAFNRHVQKVHDGKKPWSTTQIAATVVAAVVVIGGVSAFAYKVKAPDGPIDIEAQFSFSESPRLGNDSAPVQIFAFESPACSSCRHFHTSGTYQQIVQRFVDTGEAVYMEKTFFVGYDWEQIGAAFQKCLWHTYPEQFAPFTSSVYAVQDRLGRANILDYATQWASEQGLDASALRSCTERNDHKDEIDRDVKQGKRAGVRGTPTFIIVGPDGEAATIVGPQRFDAFSVAIENALVAA